MNAGNPSEPIGDTPAPGSEPPAPGAVSAASPDSPVPPADEVVVLSAKGGRQRRPASAVRAHDFRQSGFLGPSELRRIRLRHEQFIRSLAARLAIFLRLELTVQLSKIEIVGYQKFTEQLPSPTHITLFRVDPFKGVGLLVLPPRLSLAMVDRLLGGLGQMPDEARDLSEIEVALAEQIANLVLSEWCIHWPEVRDMRPVLLGHENNSRYLHTSPPETALLVLTAQTGIGEKTESLQLVFPYVAIEPLMRLLSPAMPETEASRGVTAPARWNPEFGQVKVSTTAEWQGLAISSSQISRLKAGDVLMLAPGCAAQVELRLGRVPKFLGRPGVCGNKWAVQVTEAVNAKAL